MSKNSPTREISIQFGDAFNDIVVYEDGEFTCFKSPAKEAVSIRSLVEEIGNYINPAEETVLTLSTDLFDQVLLQRDYKDIAFVTTSGFEDILTLGYFRNNPNQIRIKTFKPLIPESHSLGFNERINASGEMLRQPSPKDLETLATKLGKMEIEHVCICFLHSSLNPINETFVAEYLERQGFDTTCSCEIVNEAGEFERFSTTVISGCLQSLLNQLKQSFERAFPNCTVRLFKNDGGIATLGNSFKRPASLLDSMLGASAIAARNICRQVGDKQVISLDVGNTSTTFCIIDNTFQYTKSKSLEGWPVKIPVLDIQSNLPGAHSTIAIDTGGGMVIQSSGCDNSSLHDDDDGRKLTLTDALLFLGLIPAKNSLEHNSKTEIQNVEKLVRAHAELFAISEIDVCESAIALFESIIATEIQSHLFDKQDSLQNYTLCSTGSTSGLHACRIADAMGIKKIVIPFLSGAARALGAMLADSTRHYSMAVHSSAVQNDYQELEKKFSQMHSMAVLDMSSEGIPEDQFTIDRNVKMSYYGSSNELLIPFSANFIENFHAQHNLKFGFGFEKDKIEIVNVYLNASGKNATPQFQRIETPDSTPRGNEIVMFNNGKQITGTQFERHKLTFDCEIVGPALIVSADSSTFVAHGWLCTLDEIGNLILEKNTNV